MSGHRSHSHRLRRGALLLLPLSLFWVPALPGRLTTRPAAWSDGRLRQAPPSLSISPPSLSFGSQDIGHIQGQLLTLTNTGSAPLTITQLAITGTTPADFRLDTDTCSQVSLPPARRCVVNILFAPTAGGLRSATLAITDTATTSPHSSP